eukprot:g10662.t1
MHPPKTGEGQEAAGALERFEVKTDQATAAWADFFTSSSFDAHLAVAQLSSSVAQVAQLPQLAQLAGSQDPGPLLDRYAQRLEEGLYCYKYTVETEGTPLPDVLAVPFGQGRRTGPAPVHAVKKEVRRLCYQPAARGGRLIFSSVFGEAAGPLDQIDLDLITHIFLGRRTRAMLSALSTNRQDSHCLCLRANDFHQPFATIHSIRPLLRPLNRRISWGVYPSCTNAGPRLGRGNWQCKRHSFGGARGAASVGHEVQLLNGVEKRSTYLLLLLTDVLIFVRHKNSPIPIKSRPYSLWTTSWCWPICAMAQSRAKSTNSC